MQISIEEVPVAVRRRVAQLLENVRDSEMDPTKGRAGLTGEVTAIHRPDIDKVAYYEFAVDLGRGGQGQTTFTGKPDGLSKLDLPARTGFVIASAEAHDHPVSHWSLDREPPSRQLALTAEKEGRKIERIFKLDSLAYAGESGGELAAQTGQLPMPIEGLPDDPEKAAGKISSTLARPAEDGGSDDKRSDAPHDLIRRGARPTRVKIAPVGSWEELREVYADAFAPLLKNLAANAAPAWEIEALVEKFGEGILTGSSQKVALLERDAMVELSGEGADLVRIEMLKTSGMTGALMIHAADKELPQEVPFELNLLYRSGERETLRFFLVSETTPSDRNPDSGLSIFEE